MSRHRTERPNPSLYRPRRDLSVADRAREQDEAAGGRDARLVTRPDGAVVVASVALRCFPNSRRVYAYLRWSAPGHVTAERYVGDVSDCPDRATALCTAWARVKAAPTPSDQHL